MYLCLLLSLIILIHQKYPNTKLKLSRVFFEMRGLKFLEKVLQSVSRT